MNRAQRQRGVSLIIVLVVLAVILVGSLAMELLSNLVYASDQAAILRVT
jgi:Tfp pilus assembly protein PilV